MHATAAFPTVSICISWILARAGRSTGKGLAIRVVIIPDFGTSSKDHCDCTICSAPAMLLASILRRDSTSRPCSLLFAALPRLQQQLFGADGAACSSQSYPEPQQLTSLAGWQRHQRLGHQAQPHAWDPLHSRPSNAVAAETPRPKAQVIQCVDDASSGCLLHHQHLAGCDRQRIKLPTTDHEPWNPPARAASSYCCRPRNAASAAARSGSCVNSRRWRVSRTGCIPCVGAVAATTMSAAAPACPGQRFVTFETLHKIS